MNVDSMTHSTMPIVNISSEQDRRIDTHQTKNLIQNRINVQEIINVDNTKKKYSRTTL